MSERAFARQRLGQLASHLREVEPIVRLAFAMLVLVADDAGDDSNLVQRDEAQAWLDTTGAQWREALQAPEPLWS